MIASHVPLRRWVNYVADEQTQDYRLGQVQITDCDAVSGRDAIIERKTG